MIVGAVALGATACSLEVSYEGSSYHCDDGQTCPSGFECVQTLCIQASVEQPDGAPAGDGQSSHSLKDDTAGDFSRGTGDHAAVQARGAIEPFAYFTGGVLVHASDTGVITDGASFTWDQVQAFPSTARDSLARGADLAWGGTEIPAGLGLTDDDNWTLSFEGEIFLEAGAWTFRLDVDDHGFLDLADASGAFQRVASANLNAGTQGTFTAAANGWYPIRWTVSDTGNTANVKVSFKGPGVANLVAVPRARLRARVDAQPGLLETGFDDKLLVGDLFTTIDGDQPAFVDWASGRPADLGIAVNDYYSVRWTGQVRIDVAGDYAFRYESDDGQRLWIDGAPLSDQWDESSHIQVTDPTPLAVGWHDLVVDASESNGSARAKLTVASGPDLVGEPLPLGRLRPVEGRAERFESGINRSDFTIPDLGQAQSQITLAAPAGARVTSIDVSYAFDHTFAADLVFTLIAPGGSSTILRNLNGNYQANNEYNFFNGGYLVNAPVNGTWTLKVQDKAQQDAGLLRDFQLTVHYAGGEAPIPTSSAYESEIHDLGTVVGIDRVVWEERAPAGTGVAVRLRSCAAADCAGEPWSAPLPDPAGSTPTITPRRYLQYRVELDSDDGDSSASLESIQIDYRTSP